MKNKLYLDSLTLTPIHLKEWVTGDIKPELEGMYITIHCNSAHEKYLIFDSFIDGKWQEENDDPLLWSFVSYYISIPFETIYEDKLKYAAGKILDYTYSSGFERLAKE